MVAGRSGSARLVFLTAALTGMAVVESVAGLAVPPSEIPRYFQSSRVVSPSPPPRVLCAGGWSGAPRRSSCSRDVQHGQLCNLTSETPAEAPASQGAPTATRQQRWPRVQIPHPLARRTLTEALDTAAARLESPTCAGILTDFAAVTPSLTGRLVSLGTSIQAYLAIVVFIDDSRHRRCLGGPLAFTAPGSRVVRVCVDELMRRPELGSDYLVAVVIHEMLHTLGLPEDPPSSRDITRRVLARCGTPGKQRSAGFLPGAAQKTEVRRSAGQ